MRRPTEKLPFYYYFKGEITHEKQIIIYFYFYTLHSIITYSMWHKASSTTDSKNTQTEAGSEASGKSDSRLDDLYQQENQLFADHADVWNKAFGMMNKSDADPNGNYADYLVGTVESNKNSFTDDELKTLNEDIETIRKIEEQIAELENKNTSSDDNKKDSSKASSVFSDFSGEDFDGNKVDDSLFSGNAVTVVNFWFTGCKPCVAELSKLNELNDAIKSMGGEVVGINTETFDGNKQLSKRLPLFLKARVSNIVICQLTPLVLPVNMPQKSWPFQQLYLLTEMAIL